MTDAGGLPLVVRTGPANRPDGEMALEMLDKPSGSKKHLYASLALLPLDHAQVDYLTRLLLESSPEELKVIAESLDRHHLLPKTLFQNPRQ